MREKPQILFLNIPLNLIRCHMFRVFVLELFYDISRKLNEGGFEGGISEKKISLEVYEL